MGLNLYKLTKNSPDYADTLKRILSLSNRIFNNTDPKDKHASPSFWHERMAQPASLILYMTSGNQEVEEPVAFLFAHLRTHEPVLSSGHSQSLHIWLAGASPDYRKNGCLGRMMDELWKSSDQQQLTICTIPPVFPNMWNWLRRRNWVVERDAEGGRILLSSNRDTEESAGECS